MSTPRPATLDELLAHTGWVRALARGLVADDDQADDVAQETWLAALERPPGHRRNLRGWLGTVARNAMRQLRRGEARRSARERGVARGESVPPPEEAIMRVELRRRLSQAVLDLPEPYRVAVALRFFEELTLREIAARQGIPVSTAATHVQRGLERLRRRLDDDHGSERRAWVIALLPVLGPDRAPAGGLAALGALLSGALVMSTKAKLVVAAILLLATAVGVRQLASPPAAETPAENVAARTIPGQQKEAPPVDVAGTPSAPPVAPADATPEETGILGPVVLQGRVVGEDGKPLERVDIRVHPVGGKRSLANVRTDEKGRFSLAVAEVRGKFELVATAAGYTPEVIHLRAILEDGPDEIEIKLSRGMAIAGVVRDDAGAPLKTSVWAIRLDPGAGYQQRLDRSSPHRLKTLGFADEQGRFRITGLAPGRYRLECANFNYIHGEGSRPECEAGAAGQEIVAWRGVLLEVSIRDPDTGEPVLESVATRLRHEDGAEATGGYTVAGSLRHRGLRPGRWWIRLSAPNRRPFEREISLSADETPETIVAMLPKTPGHGFGTLRGRVILPDAAGGSTPRVHIAELNILQHFDVAETGEFEVEGLPAGVYHVFATTRDEEWASPRSPVRVPVSGTARVTLRPEPAGALRVRIHGIGEVEETGYVQAQILVEGSLPHILLLLNPRRVTETKSYTLGGLCPGRVRIVVSARDRRMTSVETAIVAGRTTEIDVSVPPRATDEPVAQFPEIVRLHRPPPPTPETAGGEGLSSPRSADRLRAVTDLGTRGGEPAIRRLAKVLREDREVSVRRAAALALGKIGRPAKIVAGDLVRALADASTVVAATAHQALARVTGKALDWRSDMKSEEIRAVIDAALAKLGEAAGE